MVSKLIKLVASYYVSYYVSWIIIFTVLALIGGLLLACTII